MENELIRKKDVLDLLHVLNVDNIAVNEKKLTESIKELPVCYNVDKVVGELKTMRNDNNQGCKRVPNRKCYSYTDCGLCLMDRAIDIVRKGGVE